MKKIILTVLTIITIWGVNAQGNNLQFNQVINQTFTVNVTANERWFASSTITVPIDKVWKITSSSAYASDINVSNERYYSGGYIKIGDHVVKESNFPVWLSSGTYTIWLSVLTTSCPKITGSISAIEFKIVP